MTTDPAKKKKNDGKRHNRDSETNLNKKVKQDFQDASAKDILCENKEALPVRVTGKNSELYSPLLDIARLPFKKSLVGHLSQFQKPSPIQSYCWPIALDKRDLIAIAETGSGKTLGFALPCIQHLLEAAKKQRNPSVLVLSPTRELAMQTEQVFGDLQKLEDFGASICIYGGVSKSDQKQQLKANRPAVVIATPGRCLDLIEEKRLDLSEISILILDEADRMLDLGFEKDVRRIIELTPSTRQTLMFSATWPDSVQLLAKQFLSKDALQVVVGSAELKACDKVTQIVTVIDPEKKEESLISLLKQHHSTRRNKIIIFALYKKEAERIEQFLLRKGYEACSLHGDKPQAQRSETLSHFKSGKRPLLIATDVAARGIDVPDVEFVINFTFPLTIEDYIHRIGRTGRGSKSGTAITFFTQHDKSHAGELVNVLRSAKQSVPEDLLKFGTAVKKKEHKDYGAFYKQIDSDAKASHIKFDSDSEE